ncbi:unnamed protein product [Heligmosomoides polygyrus]|uniref:G-protein coupled receptors family 1 profile domain-containing protein n=1 Tax=Heligmosomoides polygyrus TaxID=6339 RepID=A0A3P7WGQ6_HELPZ|nr:unnamed protein product [Heligmosomoides polygyrus]
MLPSGPVLALLPVGPCRQFGPALCFIVYNIGNAFALNVALSVFHSMYFRYRLIQTSQLSQSQIWRNLMITAILPLILFSSTNFRHPIDNRHFRYGDFGGFQSTTDTIFLFNTLILFVAAVSLPVVIFYWRYLILKTINTSERTHSEKTKHNSKRFLMALTAQAVVPLVCYVPAGLLYLASQFFAYKIVFLQYMFSVITMLPCAIDPLCTIYFITPYRTWVQKVSKNFFAPSGVRAGYFPNNNIGRINVCNKL